MNVKTALLEKFWPFLGVGQLTPFTSMESLVPDLLDETMQFAFTVSFLQIGGIDLWIYGCLAKFFNCELSLAILWIRILFLGVLTMSILVSCDYLPIANFLARGYLFFLRLSQHKH
uniref:Uncharacterized protein n=1 Tax=Opuntia streptacantha TaxID=393608 RepID=A0A7C8Z3K0_OPUST